VGLLQRLRRDVLRLPGHLVAWELLGDSWDVACQDLDGSTCDDLDPALCSDFSNVCAFLALSALLLDVDTDDDSIEDAISIGLRFESISALVTGISPGK
jgi:hypothetical protein